MTQGDILFYLRLFIGRLPLIALCAAPLAALGIVLAFTLPPTYRASARILVEAPDIPTEMARSTVVTSPVEQFQVIQQAVTTQQYLLDLARRLDIYGGKPPSDDAIADDMRTRIRFDQIAMDAPQGESRAVVFGVSFDARDPMVAARVVNDLVDYILNKNRLQREDRAEITRAFFQGEVARLSSDLKNLEGKILAFRNAKQDALPDGLDFRRSQLQTSQDRVAQLEREEASLRSRRSNLQTMFGAGQTVGGASLSPDGQLLQDLNRSLAEQLTIYREDSPTIVALRARIASVKAGLDATAQGAHAGQPTEFDLQLADIDERLAFIADERARLQATMATLSRSITETPANAAQLNDLERTRDNVQAQYNLAIAKLSEAATGEQIEINAKGSRFSLVEPATPPRSPVWPKRLQLSLLGFMAGIATGVGLALLLELLNSTIRRPAELADVIGTQPLVAIPYVYRSGEKRPPEWPERLVARLFPGNGLTQGRSGRPFRVGADRKSVV